MKVKIFPSIMKIKTNHRNNKYRNDYVKFYEYTFEKCKYRVVYSKRQNMKLRCKLEAGKYLKYDSFYVTKTRFLHCKERNTTQMVTGKKIAFCFIFPLAVLHLTF